jgi:hypothetical protein
MSSIEQSVFDDVKWLRKSPFVREALVRNTYGLIYDVKTGKVRTIVAPGSHGEEAEEVLESNKKSKRAVDGEESEEEAGDSASLSKKQRKGP